MAWFRSTHSSVVLLVGLLCGGCQSGPGAAVQQAEADVVRLKAELRTIEREVGDARREAEVLEDALEMASGQVAEHLGARLSVRDELFIDLDAELVATLVRLLLDGFGGTEPPVGDTPAAHWTLRGIRTRVHQGRLFVSGSYNVKVGAAECAGPVHGHLFYVDRTHLKLAEMALRCQSQGHDIAVDIASHLPPIPVPVTVLADSPLGVRPGIKGVPSSLDVVTPVEVRLGASRVEVRTRAITVRDGN